MIKRVILETLDFLRCQVENDKCTPEELQSIADSAASGLNICATIKDMSRFYGQSESNVRNVVSRHYCKDKPKRKVLYDFHWVNGIVPKSWHLHGRGSTTSKL